MSVLQCLATVIATLINGATPVIKKPPEDILTMEGPATYRIIVRGRIAPERHNMLGGMSISQKRSESGEIQTVLVGRLSDQAALTSVLNTLYELHLPMISADCLETG